MTDRKPNGETRVLVVEDDDDVRKLIALTLQEEGYEVLTAHDGYHALRIVATGRPDLIVLDFGLPHLDGPSFTTHWRQRVPPDDQVPIIGMSGLPNGAELARQSQVTEFFPKPLDLDALVEAVARYT